MAATYIDTTALAKWYLPEAKSEAFRDFILAEREPAIGSLVSLELRSVLAKYRRRKLLGPAAARRVWETHRRDIRDGHLAVWRFEERHLESAADALDRASRSGIGTLSALHLAIARDGGARRLATADRAMATAARSLGLAVTAFY
ncbi:MAG: type II toxin-antitoxin system VapC family toxin [Alphaproteobacteria bacterium]|nr:type II toxin-antitoxin system VapC family toxin [Alphaproteobacteria bacterium]